MTACFCWFFGLADLSALKMETVYSSEPSGFLHTTWPYNPEDRTFHSQLFLDHQIQQCIYSHLVLTV
jgi:hypothetical protein